MVSAIDHRGQAIRLLAMSICAATPSHAARLRELSEHAQREAGIVLSGDDPEVYALVMEFIIEDKAEANHDTAGEAWERCPPRE